MTTITAPTRMGRREQAQLLTAQLPESLDGSDVVVDLPREQRASGSFIDELVMQVIVLRRARRLEFRNAGESVCAIVAASAQSLGVSDCVDCR